MAFFVAEPTRKTYWTKRLANREQHKDAQQA